jgi:hypothetical protein
MRMCRSSICCGCCKQAAGWAILGVLALLVGCGRGELPRKITYGTVTCGGDKVARGKLRFVPVENSALPSSSAMITDGQYRVEQWGGVPIGKYRVEIEARRFTGRNITNDLSGKTIAETASFGPSVYAGARSPLLVEVKDEGDGRIDLTMPNATK